MATTNTATTNNWIVLLGCVALTLAGCSGDDAEDGGDGGADGTAGSGTAGGDEGATLPAESGTAAVSGGNGSSTGAGSGGGTADDCLEGGSDGCVDGGGTADGVTDEGDSGTSTGGSSGTGDEEGGEESTSDDGMMVEQCEAPGELVTCDNWGNSPEWYQVLGLGCEGGPNETIPIVGPGFNSPDGNGWALATQFGTYEIMPGEPLWAPIEGEQMLILSTGQAGVPDADGRVEFASLNTDSNGNPDNKPLPAPMSPEAGSAGAPFVGCDGVNDCSDSLVNQWNSGGQGANDLVWLQFAAQVPGGTHGFSLDFAYFSEEFPEWVGTTFNDMFVVWSNSETYTGNLCFIDDQPCTVTALWPTQHQPGDAELSQTGFTNDGATGWFQIKGSAEPHELLQLTIAVFDMGDSGWDTMVLLDNFAWDCEGCTPSEVNPCGVVDPT